jgi:hypothetical protein
MPTLEEIYTQCLFTILVGGPIKSAELIEDRPLPDLAELSGSDESLRQWAEELPSAQMYPDPSSVVRIVSALPGIRWNLLRTRGSLQVFNTMEGLPAFYKISIERFRRGSRRGLLVTAQALDPESAARHAGEFGPWRKLGLVSYSLTLGVALTALWIIEDLGWYPLFYILVLVGGVALLFFASWARKKLSQRSSGQ